MCIFYRWVYDGCECQNGDNQSGPWLTTGRCPSECPQSRWNYATMHSERICNNCLLDAPAPDSTNRATGFPRQPRSIPIYIQRAAEVIDAHTADLSSHSLLNIPPLSDSNLLSLLRIEDQLNESFMDRRQTQGASSISYKERELLWILRVAIQNERRIWMIVQHAARYTEHAKQHPMLPSTWEQEERVRSIEAEVAIVQLGLDSLPDHDTLRAELMPQITGLKIEQHRLGHGEEYFHHWTIESEHIIDEEMQAGNQEVAELFQNPNRSLQAARDSIYSRLLTRLGEHELEGDEMCSICRDTYDKNNHIPVRINCEGNHVFGEACIKDWWNRKLTCAIDRQDLLTETGRAAREAVGHTQSLYRNLVFSTRLQNLKAALLERKKEVMEAPITAPAFLEANIPMRSSWGANDWHRMESQLVQSQAEKDISDLSTSLQVCPTPSYLRALRGERAIHLSSQDFESVLNNLRSGGSLESNAATILKPGDLLLPRYGMHMLQLVVNEKTIMSVWAEAGYTVVFGPGEHSNGLRILFGKVMTIEQLIPQPA